MSAIAFDAHAFVKRLISAGMPEMQAEILADEQSKLLDVQFATLATKQYLQNGLTGVKQVLNIRVGGMIMALGGVLVAIKFLGH